MQRGRGWSVALLAAAAAAGSLLAASASTARGTDLRSGRRVQLADLLGNEARRVAALAEEARRIQDEIDAQSAAAAGRDARVRAVQDAAEAVTAAAGLRPISGPGVTVTLDDAPRGSDGRRGNSTPDDLVVHEQDVLAVINALWAGGADGVSVMGDRLVSTSAVRCVGNTLLLHGAVYSPPFVVAAVGDPGRLRAALEVAPGVRVFRDYVAAYGLGYQVRDRGTVDLPAYDGPLALSRAGAGPS